MNIPNLQLPYDRVIDPMLGELLFKLSMDKPSWHYREPLETRSRLSANKSLKDLTHAPEGKLWVYKVVVTENGNPAGEIIVDRRYRGRERAEVYRITSHRINNGRKGDTTETMNLASALRTIKKNFAPRNSGEILYAGTVEAIYKISRIRSTKSVTRYQKTFW